MNHKLIGEPIGEYKLQIQLTEQEVEERQAKFFSNHAHIHKQQVIVDAAKQTFKDNTSMHVTENTRLMKELNDGYVEKEVRAIEWPNWEKGVFEYYREDDMDLADKEPMATKVMTAKERRQFKLQYSREQY